jgi:hypothetical protein
MVSALESLIPACTFFFFSFSFFFVLSAACPEQVWHTRTADPDLKWEETAKKGDDADADLIEV